MPLVLDCNLMNDATTSLPNFSSVRAFPRCNSKRVNRYAKCKHHTVIYVRNLLDSHTAIAFEIWYVKQYVTYITA
jgi:hypothetical protein